MKNPFTQPYVTANQVTRIRMGNLLLVSLVVILAGSGLTALTWWMGDAVVSWVTGGLVLGFLGILGAQAWGHGPGFSYVAVVLLALAAVLGTWFNRSGVIEGDLFQSGGLFMLALVLTAAIGSKPWLAVGVAGLGVLNLGALMWFPLPGDFLVSKLNLSANPAAVVLIYVVSALVATVNGFQIGIVQRRMQNYHDLTRQHSQELDRTVRLRTAALQAVLDNTGQGFFIFGKEMKIEPGYSRGAREILEGELEGQDPVNLLFPHGGEEANNFRQGMELFFSGKAKSGVIFDLLEKSLYLRGKYLSVDFKETGDAKVLCILTDITAAKLLEEKKEAEAERQRLIFKALNNKHYFAGFLEDGEKLFSFLEQFWEVDSTRQDREESLRRLHTFKGNAGFFGFLETWEVAQDFEYCIGDSLVIYNDVPFRDLTLDLKKAFYRELGRITEIMGEQWLAEAGGVIVPRVAFNQITVFVKKRFPSEVKLIGTLEHLRKIPIRELFSRFTYIAESTAKKLGKKIAPLVLHAEDLRVVPEHLEALVESFVHLVNNMVDHGIEPPYVRQELGKTPEGRLEIWVGVSKDALTIQFKDDGRGIDFPAIIEKGKALGLLEPDSETSVAAASQVLFADGFTTKEEVSEVSGRGVGLAAVRVEVERMGGTISVNSKLGKGTSFEIIIPLAKKIMGGKS